MAPANKKDDARQEFDRGYVIACLNTFSMHGDSVISGEAFVQLGITRDEVKALDLSDYDLDTLKKLEKEWDIFPAK